MSLFGVMHNAQLDKLLLQIRLKFSHNKFPSSFRKLYKAFVKYDPDVTGRVSLQEFQRALRDVGFFFKIVEIQVFTKTYCKQQKMDWSCFLNHLKQPMGPQRRQIIQQIFDNIDKDGEGKVSPQVLISNFNPCQIQAFKIKIKKKQELFEEFLSLLCLNDGLVTKDQFVAYYDDCSTSFPDSQAFIRYVSQQWTFTPQKIKPVTAEEVTGALKALRFKLIQKSHGTSDQFLLRKLFNQYDTNKNQLMGAYQLDLMMKRLQIPVQPRLVKPLVIKLDKNKSGFIQYDEFKRFIFFDAY